MLLLDGDIFAYRVAWACEAEGSHSDALRYLDECIADVLIEYPEHEYTLYLTGKGNFRNEVAVTAPYKGNRKKREKPKHLQVIREYMIRQWGAVVTEGEEADDAIAIAASASPLDVMVSIDKDFNQIAGTHYNFVKGIEYIITEVEGLKLFYQQILTGDAVDNIIGVEGCGEKGALDLIHGCRKETDMWDICRDQLGEERALENARLLWLRRIEGQMWDSPYVRDDKDVHYGAYTEASH